MVNKTIFEQKQPVFSKILQVRITQVNPGLHLDHAELIKLAHEARHCFFESHDANEGDIQGVGLVVGNLEVDYLKEVFLHEQLQFDIYLDNLDKYSVDMYYNVSSISKSRIVARIRVKLVFFDYSVRKKAHTPELLKHLLLRAQ